MAKRYLLILLLLGSFFTTKVYSQYTNRGTDFWVPFPANQLGTGAIMKVYISALSVGANVIMETADGSFVRIYSVAANTTVVSENIPVTAQTTTEGLHIKKGIHINSGLVPVSVYVHIYGSASSGSAMLLPTTVLGTEHRILNITQNYGANAYSFFSVVGVKDSTDIEINPSQATQAGWTPNNTYSVRLNKGDVYQVLASSQTTDLTGSSVKSVANANGVVNPIAVFGGSTRTSLSVNSCGSGGDFVMGQIFPHQLWDTKFATAPFSNSTIASGLTTSIFRVMVKDPTTVVKRNGAILTGTVANSYYQFESNTADVITSDKPVMVAQYMTGACTGVGDPEMIYLTPLSEAIPKTGFYRTTAQSITVNYLTLIIPNAGLSSLVISDGSSVTTPDYTYPHPNLPGYQVVVKRWNAANAQVRVQSNYAFTGVTYGMGSVESYGYNIGAQFDSANLQQFPYNTIKGKLFYDNNGNGIKEADEPFFSYANLKTIRPGKDTANYYAPFGSFTIYTDTGTYVTSASTYAPYYAAVPVSHTSIFSTYNNDDSLLFAMQRTAVVRDMFTGLISTGAARPGFSAYYKLGYGNKGTDTADVIITLAKSNKLTLVSSSLPPTSVTADTIKWNISSVKPADLGSITLRFTVATPPTANINDTLRFTSIISSNAADTTPSDNSFQLKQRITGSFDPNDKMESHGAQVLRSAIISGEALNYTIRFQNTGSDTAFNITIRDTLDTKLDWTSLKMNDASHDYQLTVNDGIAVWIFTGVNLVDSNRNELLSHGYVSFSINALPSIATGDVIQNTASIYFDHNLPVSTNTVFTTVTSEALPVKLLSFTASRQERANQLRWSIVQQVNFSHFELERSESGHEFISLAKIGYTGNDYIYNDNSFNSTVNYYRLKMIDKDGKYEYSPVCRINNRSGVDVTIYPNPVDEILQVKFETALSTTLQLQVLGTDGRVLRSKQLKVTPGFTTIPLDVNALPNGIYMLSINDGEAGTQVLKFTKQ